uniref:Uncharacterized protein n=1 Tax=Anopheles farauti TaxID=69004 RepID=A0A182QYB3_9DIPT
MPAPLGWIKPIDSRLCSDQICQKSITRTKNRTLELPLAEACCLKSDFNENLPIDWRSGSGKRETNFSRPLASIKTVGLDRFVHDDPGDGFVAGRCGRRALVRHVVFGVGEKVAYRNPAHRRLVAPVPDPLELIRQHAQLGIGKVTQLQQHRNTDDTLRPVQRIAEVGVQLRVVAEDLDLTGR